MKQEEYTALRAAACKHKVFADAVKEVYDTLQKKVDSNVEKVKNAYTLDYFPVKIGSIISQPWYVFKRPILACFALGGLWFASYLSKYCSNNWLLPANPQR